MLTYIDKKRASGTMDRKVKWMVQAICKIWTELEDFERVFKQELAQMKQLNHIHPKFAYKLVRDNAKTIEVWHVAPEELIHDRLLCAVEYTSEIDIELALLESQLD